MAVDVSEGDIQLEVASAHMMGSASGRVVGDRQLCEQALVYRYLLLVASGDT
jgi:hypothetical protein